MQRRSIYIIKRKADAFVYHVFPTSTAVRCTTGLTILRTGYTSPRLEGGRGSLAPSSWKLQLYHQKRCTGVTVNNFELVR